MRYAQMLVLALAVIAGTSSWVAGQDQDRERERGRERTPEARNNSEAYQEGLRHGQEDAKARRRSQYRNQRWKDEQGRREYEAGYNQGYRNATGAYNGGRVGPGPYPGNAPYPGTGPYGNGPYGGNGRYGQYGTAGMSNARNIGYQDGLRDGQSDIRNGHSNRPTQMDNYKNADRGYSSSFGDKNQYKQLYRQGYMQGYEQSYGGRR